VKASYRATVDKDLFEVIENTVELKMIDKHVRDVAEGALVICPQVQELANQHDVAPSCDF
jgi:hypothetical protein